MPKKRRVFIALQLVGGPAVLGSYLYGFISIPELVPMMWGGVPEAIRLPYTAWMFAAAAGYLCFSAFFWKRIDMGRARLLGGGFGRVNLCYALVLFPSAAWMPLIGAFIYTGDRRYWWLTLAVLWIVAAGSMALTFALAQARPAKPDRLHALALAGAVAFSLQTVLLDAVAWPVLFRLP